MNELPQYTVRRAKVTPELNGLVNAPAWRDVPPVSVASFIGQPEHRPRTSARIQYDTRRLYVLFDVEDRYVRSTCTEHQQMVCRDSCVEIFIQPRTPGQYLNFETNCGGTMLLYRIEDPSRWTGGKMAFAPVALPQIQRIGIYHSMPPKVDPEIDQPTRWQIELAIPLDLFVQETGAELPTPGTRWQANCFKCADHTSHPHWASWSPIRQGKSFHRPDFFGEFLFE